MELIEHADLSEELKDFSFPSNPRKIISGPDDLSREQGKFLARGVRDAKEDDDDAFYERVFIFWALLPATTWNLGRKGVAIPITLETLNKELRKGDFGGLALQVTQHLFPYMFRKDEDPEQDETEGDDDLDGLEVEEGSQLAEELAQAPAEKAPKE